MGIGLGIANAKAWKDSRTPALAIVARGDQIETVSPVEYRVRSQSRPGVTYTVTIFRERWSCTCDFYVAAGIPCVHILAVRIRFGFEESAAPAKFQAETCQRCRSGLVILFGRRRNKSGSVRRFLCKSCGFRFSGREGFHRRRADPEKIALALDLYFRGLSVRKVAEHFLQVHGLKLSHVTVYKWVVHFGKLAAAWMDAQGVAAGEKWHVDETVVSVNGQNHYVWNVLDAQTRFLLATHVSRTRGMADTRAPLRKARAVADELPTAVYTDGMEAYPRAIARELAVGRRRGAASPHRRVPSIRAPESNNLVERLHGTEKERVKVMRGFDTERGTGALMEGFRAHYNLVREHQALGKTPGAAAGIPSLPGFRWHELLKRSTAKAESGADIAFIAG